MCQSNHASVKPSYLFFSIVWLSGSILRSNILSYILKAVIGKQTPLYCLVFLNSLFWGKSTIPLLYQIPTLLLTSSSGLIRASVSHTVVKSGYFAVSQRFDTTLKFFFCKVIYIVMQHSLLYVSNWLCQEVFQEDQQCAPSAYLFILLDLLLSRYLNLMFFFLFFIRLDFLLSR